MLSDSQIIKNFYGNDDRIGHKYLAESGLKKQKKEDELNRKFYNGDESAFTYELSTDSQKYQVCFNRVRPYVHSFVGFAAQNRRTPEFFAIEQDDQRRVLYTESANKMLAWIRSTANADQIETQQDKELAICGYGAVSPILDYMANPDGEVKFVECTKDYWWDSEACQPGISDRRFEYLKKKIGVAEALKRFGGEEADYQAAVEPDFSPYQYWPLGGTYDKIAYDWCGVTEKGMVWIYEYHWYDLEPYWRITNPIFDEKYQAVAGMALRAMERARDIRLSEEESEDLFSFNPRSTVLTLNKQQADDVMAIFRNLNIEATPERNLKKVYYEAVVSGNKVFRKRKSIDQSGFPIKVKTADYDHRRKIWFGMVSSLREPARYANKAVTEFLLIVAGSSKPGFFYNVTAVKNPAEFEAKAAKNAKAIAVNDINGIRDKQTPVLPNGYDQLYPAFLQALSDVIGFAPEALGMGGLSQPSFELEHQRIKQVMTTLAIYFDAITLYQKDHARSMLYYMRRLALNKEGRAIPAIDDAGQRGLTQIFSDMIAEEYAIDIGEAPDSPSQKKEQFLLMNGYMDKVIAFVPNKAQDALALGASFLPIPAADKAKWINLLSPKEMSEEEMAAAQEQSAMQKEAAIAEIKKKVADAAYSEAKAQKTFTEIEQVSALTNKTKAEAEQKDLENLAISTTPPSELNINI